MDRRHTTRPHLEVPIRQGVPFLVRTREDLLEADPNITPTVAVIIADNEHELFWAIDQIGDPYEYEFAEAESGESIWTTVDVARKGEVDDDREGAHLEFTQIWSPQESASDQAGIADGMFTLYRCSDRKWRKVTRDMSRLSAIENIARLEIPATFTRLKAVYDSMTDKERQALTKWEDEHVTGDGTYATTDWPGWDDAGERYEQREN